MLAERLKMLREKKGLTQKEFAKAINTSTSSVAMWETNKREPDNDTIRRFAEFFNVTTDYLLGITNEPKRSVKTFESPTIEEFIINNTELSDESRKDLLKQLEMMKMRDNMKKRNEEASAELRPRLI